METKKASLVGFDPATATFTGYGSVFNNTDSYGDVIAKGAFRATLAAWRRKGRWPAMLSQHGGMFGDEQTPIGAWTEMREDDFGLYVEGKLANTERGREAYELLNMKPFPAYDGLSIGFRVKDYAAGTKVGDPRRTITAIDLFEVSLVTFPANDLARVAVTKAETVTQQNLDTALAKMQAALRAMAAGAKAAPADDVLDGLAGRIRALARR